MREGENELYLFIHIDIIHIHIFNYLFNFISPTQFLIFVFSFFPIFRGEFFEKLSLCFSFYITSEGPLTGGCSVMGYSGVITSRIQKYPTAASVSSLTIECERNCPTPDKKPLCPLARLGYEGGPGPVRSGPTGPDRSVWFLITTHSYQVRFYQENFL